jgi:nucleoside-diphosphate-sugar epimerase
MSDRLVLVTGATGYLGRHLVSALVRRGYRAQGTSLGGAEDVDALDLVAGPEPIVELLRVSGADVVLHLAAAGVSGRRETFGPLVAANVLGTAYLLDAAAEVGIQRLVHVSTDLADSFTDPYGSTKHMAESLVELAFRLRGLDCVNLRLPVVFGPGEPSFKLVPSLLDATLRGESVELRTPSRSRGFLYVDDAVDAIIHGITHGEPGSTLRVPPAGRCTLSELAALVRDAVAGIRSADEAHFDSVEDALPGWRPGTGLSEALAILARHNTTAKVDG